MVQLSYNNYTAVITELGAELRSLKLSTGRELMWQADPRFWGKTSPVLFPLVGCPRGKKALFGGIEFPATRHGFARDVPFDYSKITANEASFTLNSSEATKELYPYDFKFVIKYRLLGDRLKLTYAVTNKGDVPLPFCIGAHPAFNLPFGANESFSDYKAVFETKVTASTPDFNGETFSSTSRTARLTDSDIFPLNYADYVNDVVFFDDIKANSLTLTKDGTHGVKVGWQGFTGVGLWTPTGMEAPFVCVEPWCGSADFDNDPPEFEKRRGVQTAAAGETLRYEMIISEV
ncbi:MAG: aldose 1-epimerase family protein [Oscillospiraceae bacterium]|jgi:galactose mutarotase-like enzyme|nr:aldose 1-epimerase family protein [Oscillospiraceae bacterium]